MMIKGDTIKKTRTKEIKVVFLFPSLRRGFYWQPVFKEFTKIFPETRVFTGLWPGFAPGCENSFAVRVVGKTRFVRIGCSSTKYERGVVLPSLDIIPNLIQFKPDIIITSSFTLWTILVLLLKPWRRWCIIIAYDGSSPNIDKRDSRFRLFIRRVIVRNVDAFITNSRGGKEYLTKILGVKESMLFVRPYQVPDIATLLANALLADEVISKSCFYEMERPAFLFVGRVIPGKGLHLLLQACSILQKQGYDSYSLLVVGDGRQRAELEEFIKSQGLENRVRWAGWVNYGQLGNYLRHADVFVFPTLEDTWGVVVLEAMAFGKPILCSKWAGSVEMVVDGENGYVLDPYRPEQLARLMKQFMNDPSLIKRMGERSKEIMALYTPKAAAKQLSNVVAFVLNE